MRSWGYLFMVATEGKPVRRVLGILAFLAAIFAIDFAFNYAVLTR